MFNRFIIKQIPENKYTRFKDIPEIAKKGILQVLNKLCSPTFIHPLPIHITFNKTDLIHESGAILKRFLLASTTFTLKHSIGISKVQGTRISRYLQGFRGHAPSGAFDPRFLNDKDSPEITKIPQRVRVQTIGGTSNPGAMASFASHSMYPNGSKGHRRDTEETAKRSLYPQLNGHSTCIRRALWPCRPRYPRNRYRSDLSWSACEIKGEWVWGWEEWRERICGTVLEIVEPSRRSVSTTIDSTRIGHSKWSAYFSN